MLATVFSTNTIYEHNINTRILPAPAYIHISSRTFGHQWGRLTRKSITCHNVSTYKGRHQENNLGEVGRGRREGGGIPLHYFQYSDQSTWQKLGWVSQVGNVLE